MARPGRAPSPRSPSRRTRRLSRARRTGERRWHRDGATLVAGVDEAGRGPLAGPVVAAAVILPFPLRLRGLERGDVLTDSKKLDAPARERLCAAILEATPHVGWAAVGSASIDSMNILEASREAMRLALLELPTLPDISLVDGLPVPHMPCPHEAIVGGDRIELVIAAASIVAKVTRDRLMTMYDELYPGYAFASHKGYYAPAHIAALAELGPCPIHRYSFAPVRDARDACSPGPSPGRKRHERPIEPAPPGEAWPRGGDPGDEFPDPVGV